MIRVRDLRKFSKSVDGSALIEAALVIPMLIYLMIGIIDFGRAYMSISSAEKSLRSGARYMSKLTATSLCSSAEQTKAKNLILYGSTTAGGQLVVQGWNDPGTITITLTPACATPPSTTPTDRTINIKGQVPFNALALGALGISTSFTLNTQHEERWIGQ